MRDVDLESPVPGSPINSVSNNDALMYKLMYYLKTKQILRKYLIQEALHQYHFIKQYEIEIQIALHLLYSLQLKKRTCSQHSGCHPLVGQGP